MRLTRYKINTTVLILLAFSIPISIAATNILLGLGLLLVIWRCVTQKIKLPKSSRWAAQGIIVFIIVDFVATVLSGYPIDLPGILEDKWVLVAFWVALILAEDSVIINNSAFALVVSAGLVSVYAVIQFATGFDPIQQREMETFGAGYIALGFFNHHLTLGGVLLAVLAAGLSRLLVQKHYPHRLWLFIATGSVVSGLFVSHARSAILGFGAMLVLLVILVDRRIRKYLVLAVLIGSVLLILVLPGVSQRFMMAFSQRGDHNESPRLRLWQTSINIIQDNPFFGVGQGNFGLVFDRYKVPGLYKSTAHPHNDFLSVAVDGGIVTLAVYLALLGVFIWQMILMFHNGVLKSELRWLPGGGLALMAGICVAGLFQNYMSDAEVGGAVWFSLGLIFSPGALESR